MTKVYGTGTYDFKRHRVSLPFDPEVVKEIYVTELKATSGRKPVPLQRVTILEVSHYLENYPWQNFYPGIFADEVDDTSGSRMSLLYCGRLLEFLNDMLNQLPTRRYLRPIVADVAVVAKCRPSPLYKHGKGKLLAQLVDLLQFYEKFEIKDHDGTQLTEDEALQFHYDRFMAFQLLAFQKIPKYVSGCEIIDEEGNLMNDFTGRVKRDEWKSPKGEMRTVTVALDAAQYQIGVTDIAEKGAEDLYSTFNVLMRRKPKENNFKAILESIRDLMNEYCIVPEWLHNVFLRYGNPSAAQWPNMPNLFETVDFKDTFLDANHLSGSFPDYEVSFINADGAEALDPRPPFRITLPKTLKGNANTLSGNKIFEANPADKVNMVDASPKEKLIYEGGAFGSANSPVGGFVETEIGSVYAPVGGLVETQVGGFLSLVMFLFTSKFPILMVPPAIRSADESSTAYNYQLTLEGNVDITERRQFGMVVDGMCCDRKVSVKAVDCRHVKNRYMIENEITNLILADSNEHIISYYFSIPEEECIYSCIERFSCRLDELLVYWKGGRSDCSKSWQASMPNESRDLRLKLLKDVTEGIKHLHSLRIVHRGLRPSSIYIVTDKNKELTAKIGEMRIAWVIEDANDNMVELSDLKGTNGWKSHEQLSGLITSTQSDIFNLGCLFSFTLSGHHPFNQNDTLIKSNKCKLPTLIPPFPEALSLIERLLKKNPKLRLTACDILKHPVFWEFSPKLEFLSHIGNRVKRKSHKKSLYDPLVAVTTSALGCSNWKAKLMYEHVLNLERHKEYTSAFSGIYSAGSLPDLLRALRNTRQHFGEYDPSLDPILVGTFQTDYDVFHYFDIRFPNLFTVVYDTVYDKCKGDQTLCLERWM